MARSKGNGGPDNPWQEGGSLPPDIEDLFKSGSTQLRELVPQGGGRGLSVVAVIALLLFGAWTAYYTVPSDSVAVVQRFGKYLKDVPPGLHFKLPLVLIAQRLCRSSASSNRSLASLHRVLPIRSKALATGNAKPKW